MSRYPLANRIARIESRELKKPRHVSERAKGAANLKTSSGKRRNGVSKTPFWTTVSPHDAFSAPLAHPQFEKYSKDITANQTEFGVAIRIVRF